MSARWLDRPVHTRSFEHEGRSYVVRAFSSPDDPTRIKFEATADDRPVPIPGLPDGIMPLQPPHDHAALLEAIERLLCGRAG